MSARLAVVGGGVIGSMIAWRAARSGWRTTLYDPSLVGSGTAVAGGMLGCAGEGRPGEDTVLAFAIAARERWPRVLADLGSDDVSVAADTLLVAGDSADAGYLRSVVEHLTRHCVETRPLDRAAIRCAADGVGSGVRRGHLVPGEGAVDNRALVAAVRAAAVAAGVVVVPETITAEQMTAEKITAPAALDVDQVVVATGSWAPELIPGLPVVAEKGEILRLTRPPSAPEPPAVVVRARWHGRSVYVVPRTDGVVVGATQYEAGDRTDTAPRAGGVRDLLLDAIELMPSLAEYRLTEVGAGLRPTTPDGLPLVGRIDSRTVVAVGHGRNGILTAPLTADIVVGLLGHDDFDTDTGSPTARWTTTLDPRRFA